METEHKVRTVQYHVSLDVEHTIGETSEACCGEAIPCEALCSSNKYQVVRTEVLSNRLDHESRPNSSKHSQNPESGSSKMRFSAVFLSLLSVSAALPVLPRQEASLAPQLLSTINDLNGAVVSLTNAVNGFDGNLLGLLPQLFEIVKTETTVDVTTVKATYITNQSSNFTAAESSEIVSTLATQIGPIQDSLTALKTKVLLSRCLNLI